MRKLKIVHWLAVLFIRIGFALLEPQVKKEALWMLGIAGRKGII